VLLGVFSSASFLPTAVSCKPQAVATVSRKQTRPAASPQPICLPLSVAAVLYSYALLNIRFSTTAALKLVLDALIRSEELGTSV
jgi:hypothetical protein